MRAVQRVGARSALRMSATRLAPAVGASFVAASCFYKILRSEKARSMSMSTHDESKGTVMAAPDQSGVTVATWNIAAINNNPFEYWVDFDQKEDYGYNALMDAFENFIQNPGQRDVLVSEVFTEEMYQTLNSEMVAVGWDAKLLEQVHQRWEKDFKKRTIVNGFMKDKELGSKRLCSMPDRITNTINLKQKGEQSCRPTVTNASEGDMSSVASWWPQWIKFMFHTELELSKATTTPYAMLGPIKKSKYPALTEEEEAMSIPLQTLAMAIFDAILIHSMNVLATDSWQDVKKALCLALQTDKFSRTCDLLAANYKDADIICLQEVAELFVPFALSHPVLGTDFTTITPAKMCGKRDQNSLILLRKGTFPPSATSPASNEKKMAVSSAVEVTEQVGDVKGLADGDLLVISVKDRVGSDYLIASFHGDTNGLVTIPVLSAVHETAKASFPNHRLVFGMDGNTTGASKKGCQDVAGFTQDFGDKAMTSCWGDRPDLKVEACLTTYNARTYLQAQLNKAIKREEIETKSDHNPKDYILAYKNQLKLVEGSTFRDNTGKRSFVDTVFPTLGFPSDHAIVSTTFVPRESKL